MDWCELLQMDIDDVDYECEFKNDGMECSDCPYCAS